MIDLEWKTVVLFSFYRARALFFNKMQQITTQLPTINFHVKYTSNCMLVIYASLHVNCFESIENSSEIPNLISKEVRDRHHKSFQILVLCRLFFQVCFNCNIDKSV